MHIAFVSPYDTADIRAYSGTPYFLVSALRDHVERLSVVGPLPVGGAVRGRLAKLRHRLGGRNYLRHHTELAVRRMGEAASAELQRLRPDAVLAPSTLPVAFLETDAKTAFWPDATFESNLMFYPDFTGLPDENVAEGHRIERRALRTVDLALFATRQAARSATGYYGAPEHKVHVVEYGANLHDPPDTPAVEASVEDRARDRCQLLFVGSGWVRKGGDVALRVAEEMTASGLPTELVVAGAPPPVEAHPLLRSTGFLRKDNPAQLAELRRLFSQSHFLCMPVRAEDFGCVFAEAAAFGLPSITTDIGGMPTTVGEDGLLFPFQARPQEIAAQALSILGDTDRYRALALRARARFEARLNWRTATERVVDLFSRL